MTLHIGIVGCSAEGAALCYRTICTEGARLMGGHAHPEVSMHTPPLDDYMAPIGRGDWRAVGELMLASAEKLARIGADLLICPDNTIHQAFDQVAARMPRPWLHIADVVADEAALRGARCVGVLGTRWLVDSDVYPARFAARGIEAMRPNTGARDAISAVIMDELVRGVFRPSAVALFQRVIASLAERGADAVVLGCTEIPLIIDDSNVALPTLDSTRLLARAAVQRALQGTLPAQ